MRLTSEELNEIKKKYGVDTLWSWSRLEKARTSKNEFFLQYIRKVKEDRTDCVYGTMGSLCHDALEKLYENQIEYNEMINYFNSNWIAVIDIMNLKFDRNDSEKNRTIAAKYKENLEEFFEHHCKIPYKVLCEKFILTNFDGIIFQGYADAIYKDGNGDYNIIDFKTSTKYSASQQKEKCGQLVCYALGLHQMANVPLDKIKIAWNFLKYATVEYEQADGKIGSKDVERRELGLKLSSNVKMWLKKLGYKEQIDEYVGKMIAENSIDCLPDDVKKKFRIKDCYVYVDLTDELIQYWTNAVKETVSLVDELTKKYNEELLSDPVHADSVWMDSIEEVEKESYYYANLSGYSALLNRSYARYLDYLESKKNGGDLFSGVGSDLDLDDLFPDAVDAPSPQPFNINEYADEYRVNIPDSVDDYDMYKNNKAMWESIQIEDEMKTAEMQNDNDDDSSNDDDDEEYDMSWLDGIM